MTDAHQQYAMYHARDPWAMIEPREDRWLISQDLHYKHVALVNAPLERVFALTNHQDEHGWTRNPEVEWYATDAPLRSTSVGDVILCRQTNQAWLVMPIGFKEIFP